MAIVSLVVCTYNRCVSLRETLQALKRQSLAVSGGMEIIVVDNNSTDRTKAVVDEESISSLWPIHYVFEMNQGLSHARNRGIRESRGKFIIFTDDDVLPEPNWVLNLWSAASKYGADALGGKVLPLWSRKPPRWLEIRSVWGPLALLDRGDEVIIPTRLDRNLFYGANMAFRKSVFTDVGYFRTDLGVIGKKVSRGEDTEMLERVFRAGRRMVHTPNAVVRHKVDVNRMHFSYIRRVMYESGRGILLAKDKRDQKIPRWFVRECLESGVKAFYEYTRGHLESSINQEMAFWFGLGQIMGSWKR